ncbi:MAG TPA: hypothetical protein VH142_10100 [Polyangiaceae bacterium]|nr:hypothetical protein [Polyangiaceae bacterium]
MSTHIRRISSRFLTFRGAVAPALLLAVTAGCGSTNTSSATSFADVTFHTEGFVPAGGEATDCTYVALPADRGEIAVNHAESHFTPGSHHFLVFRTNSTSVPDGGATVHPCTDLEQVGNFKGTYYEAQAPDSSRALPPGVAHLFEPGEVLLLTSHYLNTTTSDLQPKVSFVLHTMDPKKVEQEAGSIFFYNPSIVIPPLAQVSATRVCPLSTDIHLALLWSHMHSRGVDFKATSSDQTVQQSLGDLYDSSQWSEPAPRAFPYDPSIPLPSGSSISYTCNYDNTTSKQIVQGPSAATNEMCILHGMYWPRMDAVTEQCALGKSSGDGSGLSTAADGGAPGDAAAD